MRYVPDQFIHLFSSAYGNPRIHRTVPKDHGIVDAELEALAEDALEAEDVRNKAHYIAFRAIFIYSMLSLLR